MAMADFKVKEGLIVGGGDLHFTNAQAATIEVDAETTGNTVGKALTISAGDGAGSGAGGAIVLKTAAASAALDDALTLGADKSATFTGAITGATSLTTTGKLLINAADASYTPQADGELIHVDAVTLTTGTAQNQAATDLRLVALEAPTVVATNTGVTMSNMSTLYIGGAPVDSTNISATNKYALNVAAGEAKFAGTLTATGALTATGTSTLSTVDIGAGAIDGTTIGASSATTGEFTSITGTGDLKIKYDAGEYVTHSVSSTGVYSMSVTDAGADSGQIQFDAPLGTRLYQNSLLAQKAAGGAGYMKFTIGDASDSSRDADRGLILALSEHTYRVALNSAANGTAAQGILELGNGATNAAQSSSNLPTQSQYGDANTGLAIGPLGEVYRIGDDDASNNDYLKFDGDKWVAAGVTSGAVTAINSAAVNNLVTIGSTTTELDSEANLLFDGNTLDVRGTGSAKAIKDIVAITNKVNASDMDGTGAGIQFNQWYYDGSSPATADSGRIAVVTETDWTNTASTQDSYMSFMTALNGTVAEKMRITSGGRIGIGTPTPTVPLDVVGEVKIQGAESTAAALSLIADEGDDSNDTWKFSVGDGGSLTIGNDASGSNVAQLTLTPHATQASSTTRVEGELVVDGNLTVSGDQTVLNTTAVVAEDKTIVLGIAGGMEDATYARDGSAVVTVTSTSHGINDDEYVYVSNMGNSISDGVYQISSPSTHTFVLDGHGSSGTVSAGATMQHSSANVTEATADGAGIYAPGTSLHAIEYDSTNGWSVTDDLDIASGKHLSMGGNTVLSYSSSEVHTGTIGTGVWEGTAIASAYLDADTAHLGVAQTFTAKKQIDLAAANYTVGTDGSHLHIEGGVAMNDATTGGSGTAAKYNMVSLEAPSITATNAITTTDASTLYISGGPTGAGTNTVTNSYAAYLGGPLGLEGVCKVDAASGQITNDALTTLYSWTAASWSAAKIIASTHLEATLNGVAHPRTVSEFLVTYDGQTSPSATADINVVEYAMVEDATAGSLGTFSVVKNNGVIDFKFDPDDNSDNLNWRVFVTLLKI